MSSPTPPLDLLSKALLVEAVWLSDEGQASVSGHEDLSRPFWAAEIPLLGVVARSVVDAAGPRQQLCGHPGDWWWLTLRVDGGVLALGPLVERPPRLPPEVLYEIRVRFVDEALPLLAVAQSLLHWRSDEAELPLVVMAGRGIALERTSQEYLQSPLNYVRRSLRQRVLNTIRSGSSEGWDGDVELMNLVREFPVEAAFDPPGYHRQFVFFAAICGQAAEDAGAEVWGVQSIVSRYLAWSVRAESIITFGTLFLRMVSELTAAVAHSPFQGTSQRVAQAIDYLMDHLAEPVTLTEVARAVGLSPQYLIERLKVETGGGFRSLLARLRVDQARHWLRTTPQSVAEVAAAVGFAQANQFARVFRRVTGLTPTEYRADPTRL